MLDIKNILEDLCVIKETHFDELFDKYFDKKNIDISFFEDKNGLYNNLEIIKIIPKDRFKYTFINELFDISLLGYSGISGIKIMGDATKFAKSRFNKYSENFTIDIDSLTLEGKEDYKKGDLMYNGKEAEKDKIVSHLEIIKHLHGDVGEMILYFFIESILKAPMLYSKIRVAKWEDGNKVKGSDGVHIFFNDAFGLYFGESKITKSISDCINQAKTSIETFVQNKDLKNENEGLSGTVNQGLGKEIRMINSHFESIQIRFPELYEQIFNYINPYYDDYKKQDQDMNYEIVSLFGYRCKHYSEFSLGATNQTEYNDNLQDILKEIFFKLNNFDIKDKKIKIFLLPLFDELELIKIFLKKLNN